MDVKYINPFLESFTETLPMLGFQSVIRTDLKLVDSIMQNPGVLVNIALIGQIKGIILIGMEIEVAKYCAKQMMMGMDVPEFDPIAQSAISELGNMVSAGACTRFSNIGIEGLDISPPTLLIGAGCEARLPVPKAIDMQFKVDDLPMNLFVGVVEH